MIRKLLKEKKGNILLDTIQFLKQATTKKHVSFLSLMCIGIMSGYATIGANAEHVFEIDKITVSGQVYDEVGEPLPGATVLVKGTTDGTVTDIHGQFSIEMDELGILVFSFIGYQTQEISDNFSNISIKMTPDIESLDEVVVVGYGTQKKRNVTGAISSLAGETIADLPLSSVDQVLQGRMSGVQVVNSGSPGGYVGIRIRGTGTVNNSDPLFVVDGFPIQGGISAINPDDIASIDVLKDASSAAIYGARGANGVVIVTTKRGEEGKTSVELSSYVGFQEVVNKVDLLNASQYATLYNEQQINGGGSAFYANPMAIADSAQWVNELLRSAAIQNYSISVRGGNSSLRYMLSGGYFKQDGVILGTGFDRKSFRLNLDHNTKDWLKIGNSLSYSMSTFQNKGEEGMVRDAMIALPLRPVVRNGEYTGPGVFGGDVVNPIGRASVRERGEVKHRILDNLFLAVQPVKWLTFKTEFGVDMGFEHTRNFSPSYSWGINQQALPDVYEKSFERIDWLWDNTVTYQWQNDLHDIKVMSGVSAQHSEDRFVSGYGQGLVSEVTNTLNNVQQNPNVDGYSQEFALFSYIGRINYGFKDKYLLTATGRYDGSSRFGSNNRFGFFPSASVGWIVSKESFFPKTDLINNLKIRAAYGKTGNQNSLRAFSYVSLLNTSAFYTFGNSTIPAAVPQNMPNPDLKWEEVVQTNIALEMMLFKGLLGVTAEYYIRDTENMLLQSRVPITTGFFDADLPILNVGTMRNKGLELALNIQNDFGEFSWTSDFNITFNQNEITKLSGPNGDDTFPVGQINFNSTAGLAQVGQSYGAFYGYQTDGIFQSNEEVLASATQEPGTAAGDIRFKNVLDDGVIDQNDRTIIGNPNPDFYYGWVNTFRYKGFDLAIAIQGVYGNDIFNANRLYTENMAVAQNQNTNVLNRWRGAGTSNSVPRAISTDPNNNDRVSDRYIEDGSYIRIKNLTFGYSLPQSVVSKVKICQIRAYASIQNLLTFTEYSGFDPEIRPEFFSGSPAAIGVDNSTYPQSRTYTLGFNISF